MTFIVRVLTVVVLTVSACLQSGCLLIAAAAGTGATVAYVAGDLNSAVDAPPDKVAVATKAAMEKLKINVISTESTSVDAKVVGRTARDTRLTVTAKSSTSKSSEIAIRAGAFGDDALQARLLEAIRLELDEAASAAAPASQPVLAGERP